MSDLCKNVSSDLILLPLGTLTLLGSKPRSITLVGNFDAREGQVGQEFYYLVRRAAHPVRHPVSFETIRVPEGYDLLDRKERVCGGVRGSALRGLHGWLRDREITVRPIQAGRLVPDPLVDIQGEEPLHTAAVWEVERGARGRDA